MENNLKYIKDIYQYLRVRSILCHYICKDIIYLLDSQAQSIICDCFLDNNTWESESESELESELESESPRNNLINNYIWIDSDI
jgi:hypothetical protein